MKIILSDIIEERVVTDLNKYSPYTLFFNTAERRLNALQLAHCYSSTGLTVQGCGFAKVTLPHLAQLLRTTRQ